MTVSSAEVQSKDRILKIRAYPEMPGNSDDYKSGYGVGYLDAEDPVEPPENQGWFEAGRFCGRAIRAIDERTFFKR